MKFISKNQYASQCPKRLHKKSEKSFRHKYVGV